MCTCVHGVQANIYVQAHMPGGAHVCVFIQRAKAKCPSPGPIPTLFIHLFTYFETSSLTELDLSL